MSTGKQFKWITYDAELENVTECALKKAAETLGPIPTTSAGIRFLNHEGPNEKSDEFRRTVRMHVMRDYRARMREKDPAALGPPGSPAPSQSSPQPQKKKKPASLQLPKRTQQKLRVSRQGTESQSAGTATSQIPSPLPSPAYYDYSPLPSPGILPSHSQSPSQGPSNIPQIVYNMSMPITTDTSGTDVGYCSEDSDGVWSRSYVHSPAHSCGGLSLPGTPSAYNTQFTLPGMSQSPEPYALDNIDRFMVPPIEPPEARELLEHYLISCDRIFPYDNDFNPIKQKLLPLASRSLATLYGIMAAAAVHLANMTNGSKVSALYYRQKSIELLNKEIVSAISSASHGGDRSSVQDALVAAYFIGTFDYLDCGIANLQTWMAGASSLVEICGGPEKLGFDGLLFRIFSWTDIIGSTLTLKKPKLPMAFLKTEDSGETRDWPSCHFWSCPSSLIRIISDIATLSGELHHSHNRDISTATAAIESQLLRWNCAAESRPPYGDDWEAGFEAFRLAALLCLYLLPMQLLPTELRVQSTVAAACRLLGSLGEYSQVEKPMVWVYFMIGAGAMSNSHRHLIRNRMENASSRTGVGAWDGALKVLRGMWDAGDTLWNTLLVAEQHGVSFQFV